MEDTYGIKEFWKLYNNSCCWRIQRDGRVDFYWFIPTNRYIFKNWEGDWFGRKKYINNNKTKKFNSEDDAVKWLQKIK
jgi:hypothetical protein